MLMRAGGVRRRGEGDAQGVKERVLKREQELAGAERGEGIKGKIRGGERLDRDCGDVVDGDELDAKTGALGFGFGFYEDVTACAAAFVAFCAEEGGRGKDGGCEALGVELSFLLGGAGCAGEALLTENSDCVAIGRCIYDVQTLGLVSAFPHGLSFGGSFLA